MSLLLVDNHSHAILTMLSLRAVKPHRCRRINHYRIRRHVRRAGRHGHESGVETRGIGV